MLATAGISHGLNGLNGFKSVQFVQSVAYPALPLFAHLPGCEFFRYTAALKVGSPRMTKLRLGGLISFVLGTLLLMGSFDSTLAQVTATVSGRIEDATGASVGGATITIKS